MWDELSWGELSPGRVILGEFSLGRVVLFPYKILEDILVVFQYRADYYILNYQNERSDDNNRPINYHHSIWSV